MTTKLAYTVAEAAQPQACLSHHRPGTKTGVLATKRTSINQHGDPLGRKLILAADLEAWLDGLVDG